MTDLAVVASRLSRAADKLKELVEEAPAGPWTVSDVNEGSEYPPLWMVTNDAFHNPSEDEPWLGVEVHTGSRNEAEHIATFDPRTVAALVPLLRTAEATAEAFNVPCVEAPDCGHAPCWMVEQLSAFAALLLGEEETGG